MDQIIEDYAHDLRDKTIAVQRAKKEAYDQLVEEGLPIPHDLREEFSDAPDRN